jgi:hypothetical protein
VALCGKLFFFLVATVPSNPFPADLSTGALSQLFKDLVISNADSAHWLAPDRCWLTAPDQTTPFTVPALARV